MREDKKTLLLSAVSDGVPWSALKVAVVVGTVLNAINQADAIFGSVPISWPKLVLTYLVPYAVFTFGAVSAKARQFADVRDSRAGPILPADRIDGTRSDT